MRVSCSAARAAPSDSRRFRELRVERIWEGTSEVQRAIIADQLGKRGRARIV